MYTPNSKKRLPSLLLLLNALEIEYFLMSLDFKKIADLYDAKYQKVNSEKQLDSALTEYKNISGIKIIDAQVDINQNKKILQDLKKNIKKGAV